MKSKIGFGKLKDYTVSDAIISLHHCLLVGMYYRLEKIDFTNDILELLLIEPIEKPGKDYELANKMINTFWQRFNEKNNRHRTDKEILSDWNKHKRDRKRKAIVTSMALSYSMGKLQRINQCHRI